MTLNRFARFCIAGLSCLLAGCAEYEPFSHVQRTRYSISDQEIRNLQFYLSGEVIVKAHEDSGDDGVGVRRPVGGREPVRGQGTVIAPRNTPGIATEVGSNWIRVSFEPGGPGVPFAADAADTVTGRYFLSTRDEDSGKMVRVRDIPRREFTIDGTKYELVYGSTVYLVVKPTAMRALIEKRRTLEGRLLP